MKAFHGTVIHAPYDMMGHGVVIIQNSYVIVNDGGDIVDVVDLSASGLKPEEILIGYGVKEEDVVKLGQHEALIPGFIDVHLHAPQYSYTGTATDRPLMEWLTHYTFPAESSHENLAWAEEVYSKLVKRLLANGTTTAVYFATLHAQPTMLLADTCFNLGQRAFIGKVNMDRNSPDNYIETTDESISATERVISHIRSKGSPEMLIPIITPRFVPTCTPGMLLLCTQTRHTHACTLALALVALMPARRGRRLPAEGKQSGRN
jgi:guanine deaminase